MSGFRKPLILLMCASIISSHVSADQRARTEQQGSAMGVVDVSLNDAGMLTGRYLDSEGRGIPQADVVLHRDQQLFGRTQTGENGAYRFGPVQPGLYRVSVDQQTHLVRIWDAASRPPAAGRLLTIVRREPVIRGQLGDSLVAQLGLAAGLTGAIAAGIAIAESQEAQDEAAAVRLRFFKLSGPASP